MAEAVGSDKGASAAAGPSLDWLLLVARGSRDDSATAEMHNFARLRQQATAWASPTESKVGTAHPTHVEVAFLAMARPLLSEKLAEVAARHYTRVIVQPHFLFSGELVDSIGTQVVAMASNQPKTEWLLTAPLADPPGFVTPGTALLQKVIFDRLQQVGIHVVAPAGDD
jgi:sirohydrochlorin ferrochelatase